MAQQRATAAAFLPCLRARLGPTRLGTSSSRVHLFVIASSTGTPRYNSTSGSNLRAAPLIPGNSTARVTKSLSGSTSASPPASSASGTPRAAVDRTRSKLPTAKAKAQASKALRQQLQAASQRSQSFDVIQASERVTDQIGRTHADEEGTHSGHSSKGNAVAEQNQQQHLPQQHSSSPWTSHSASVSASSAAAQLKARIFPSPSQLEEVVAWATADSYDFDALIRSGRLPSGWTLLEDDEAIHIPFWPQHFHPTTSQTSQQQQITPAAGTGEVFIFRSGSYVTWGLSEDQSHRFLRSVIRGRPASRTSTKGKACAADELPVEHEKYHHIGDEGMEWVWREDEPTRIVGDVLVLGHAPHVQSTRGNKTSTTEMRIDADVTRSKIASSSTSNNAAGTASDEADWSPLLARLAYSQGLARSARLSAQEEALDMFLSSVNSIPEQLEAAGKVPLPRKEVIRKMGTLLRLRQRANLGKDNFLDDPEGHWDNGSMEYHYDEICRSLDIEPRFRALNEKLDHCENLLGVIRALLTERSSHRMELIIIYLIAFEATLAVISHDYVPTPKRIWRVMTGLGWNDAKSAQHGGAAPADTNNSNVAATAAHSASNVASSPSENVEIGLTIGLLRRALSLLDLQGEDAETPTAHGAATPTSARSVRLV
ncbi:hypothetical protein K437DRAFT_234705 [Tilletiaria anomala UBC 951]|uniref:DUF155 domain-containing protein n=1 Tax=Tilletiaria anomala (strain ATCC 24038 / CBS 436.72 / UBC 951) TaxID=1037660 RepID=A0A066W0Q6_TILAU|nr:uncharacterized protein K437DRAFT_234705 [Tilletiaria anomala UBC 951]KDN47557.1 hypothetical protein K437DRAFT_234705 [Tilletiaria anomala UBC 951]